MSEWNTFVFNDVLSIINGKNQRDVEDKNGIYPIYGSGGIMGYANDFLCPENTVIIGRKGSINKPIFVEEKFWNVDTAFGLVAKKGILESKYLYYFCEHFDFEHLNRTVTIPSLTKADLLKIQIPLPTLEEQKRIAAILDKCTEIIAKRKTQLNALDEFVKARFVEMFGDPVQNTANLATSPMTKICDIIDGDRGINYPKQEDFFEEEYCLFLNAKNVTSHGFDFSECIFITKEKDAALRKGKLQRGDVVLTTRGTLGNLAFYSKDVPFDNVRINSGMVILRMNKEIIDEKFFIEQFRMQVDDIKKSIASGSAQPQLPISTMNKIRIIMPDLSRQKQFADFVAQTDKSKSAIQKALEESQLLFDSLMQEYFG